MARAVTTQRKALNTLAAWTVGLLIFFPILWTILTSFKTEATAIADPPGVTAGRVLSSRPPKGFSLLGECSLAVLPNSLVHYFPIVSSNAYCPGVSSTTVRDFIYIYIYIYITPCICR